MKKMTWILILMLCTPGWLLAQPFRPGDQNLLIMPTAETVPVDRSQLASYELVFLNFTTGLGPRTHAGMYAIFPVTVEFLETATVEVKHNYLQSSKIRGAAWATVTPKPGVFSFGNVFSVVAGKNTYHFAASYWTDFADDNEWLLMAGAQFRTSSTTSFIVEYTSLANLFDSDYTGILSLGIRLQGERFVWDLAGLRPLEDTGDLLLIPLIKVAYLF